MSAKLGAGIKQTVVQFSTHRIHIYRNTHSDKTDHAKAQDADRGDQIALQHSTTKAPHSFTSPRKIKGKARTAALTRTEGRAQEKPIPQFTKTAGQRQARARHTNRPDCEHAQRVIAKLRSRNQTNNRAIQHKSNSDLEKHAARIYTTHTKPQDADAEHRMAPPRNKQFSKRDQR